ncbi:MAG: hypothetical protein J1E64_15140 [Acetatifactor sp.]|nr:hypothetical protein [Acetatifactor sp.]
MKNVDEEILKQRAAAEQFEKRRFSQETIEKENEQSIFQGEILINQIPVTFQEKLLIEEKIGIWMPEDFEAIPEEAIAEIYLLGNKPELVMGNSYLNFSIGFHYTQHEVPNEYMGDFLKIARLTLERCGPKVRIMSEKVRQVGNHTVSSLELISHTVTDSVYNIMFFSSLEGKILIGFINFNHKFTKRYLPIAKEMLTSFRFVEDEQEGGEE